MTFKFIMKYRKIIYFVFAFYFAMTASSYVQILYFQENDKLQLFSLYYSVMAVTGAFSFIISNRLVGYSINRLNKIFIVIYAIGLVLRIFVNNVALVVLSAMFCGICASIVLILLRRWIYLLTDSNQDERGKIHSIRFFFMQLAGILASAMAGLIFKGLTLFFPINNSFKLLLIASSFLMMSNSLIRLPESPDQMSEKKRKRFFLFPKTYRTLALVMYCTYIILGISASVVSSILPAIIKTNGWSVEATSFIVSVLTVCTLVFSYIYQVKWVTLHAGSVFLSTQLATVALCFLALELRNIQVGVLVIGLVTEISLAGFFILKELLEYGIIPKSERTVFLGLLQSSFLIGDSLGSPIGSYIFSHSGLTELVLFYGCVSVLSAVIFYLLTKRGRNTTQ